MTLAAHLGLRSMWAAVTSRTWPAIEFYPASTGLSGSEWLHLPTAQAAQFESLSRDAATNCSVLFTMPGMASFNIWSGIPTPTGWNLTAWMRGINTERQAEILSTIQANTQACAILNRTLVRFWDKKGTGVADLPLARYVMVEMPKVRELGEYEIHVHPNRTSSWSPSR